MERRVIKLNEVRASESGKERRLTGYAARYGVLSKVLPGPSGNFRERIAAGAFDGILATKPDVVMTLNHDQNLILGRTGSGTLQLSADDKGLAYDCLLPNTTAGRDAYESVKRGDLNGCSFAFADVVDELSEEDEPPYRIGNNIPPGYIGKAQRFIVRTIKAFRKLFDVSVVTDPAYAGTSVDARNLVAAEVRSRFESFTQPRTRSLEDRLAEEYGELYVANLHRAIQAGTYISLREAKAIARRRNIIDLL